MSKISEKIMRKLKKEEIKMIPRWRFVLKRAFIWGSLVVAVSLGAFSISMIMFQIIDVDWDLFPKVAPSPFLGILQLIPYFWLVVSFLLFVFVYFDFRNTRKGYKYSGVLIILASLTVSLFLGTGIYFLKAPRHADDFFNKVPIYHDMHMGREMLWNVPERGVLAGVILEIRDGEAVILEDFSRNTWTVDVTEAKIPKRVEMIEGEKIKCVGEITGGAEFYAVELRPFRKPF